MEDYIEIRYYLWITGWANELCSPYGGPYSELMHDLSMCPFEAYVKGDENRVTDTNRLRDIFCEENHVSRHDLDRVLKDQPVSLLEVMLTMAIRCEQDIMGDGVEDRMPVWFFDMICSAELDDMYDSNYDPAYVDFVLERIVGRTYERNGTGGLFTVTHPAKDLRKTELWYQMCWHLSELVEDEK